MRALPLVLLLLCGCQRKGPPPPPVLSAPLELTLPRYPDRQPFTLSSERGHVLLLDVWATWCTPCLEALPRYQALAQKHAAQGVLLYAISVDGEPAVAEALPKFLAERHVSAPVLLDLEGATAAPKLQVQTMPTTLVLDRAGRVRHVQEGVEDGDVERVEQVLEALERLPAEVVGAAP